MRMPAQQKILEHFLEHLTKLQQGTSIEVIQSLNDNQKQGIYIKIPNLTKGHSTYFIGRDKTYGDNIVEKLA